MILATPAAAVSAKDIAGKWCSERGSQEFTRDNFTVIRASDGGQRVYSIERYEDRGTEIAVLWKDSRGIERTTTYGEFSGDGNSMTQLQTKEALAVPFHRC